MPQPDVKMRFVQNTSERRIMQIIVPMAGKSNFFPPEHYFFPKSLVEVHGRPMIEWVVDNLRAMTPDARFLFIVHEEEISRFSMDRTLRFLTDDCCEIVSLRQSTLGALCSALLVIDHLDMEQPVVIANSDQIIDADLSEIMACFNASEAQAGVITFDSVHPRWSYVSLDEGKRVIQAAEKAVISRNAIAGLYYFRTARIFVEAAMRSIENKAQVDGQYFIAPCLNEIILQGGLVVHYPIPDRCYFSLYSPDKIAHFENTAPSWRASLKHRGANITQTRVVIPAAGLGSRFSAAGYAKPKPFIDVLGEPMIEHVIRNVTPSGAEVHLLLRGEHVLAERRLVDNFIDRAYMIHEVEKTTEGTACTLLLARAHFDDDRPVLVANSDQLVDFSVDAFIRDCASRALDGSILVFRDPTQNPKWSFARVNNDGLVTEVAEKKPISDLATVGIYLFRRGSDFVAAAVDMIARNDRVNNEFYTCPVYNYMIAAGLKIGVYEIPQSAMHGLGTPEDLEAYLAIRSSVGQSL